MTERLILQMAFHAIINTLYVVEKGNRMSSQNFGMKNYMKGALLLTIAALIVKILSAVYRVPFQNLVGDQGFYVYQQVYPFISFFVVWTSSGFAVAISKMLADIEARSGTAIEKRAVSRVIFNYLTVLSLLFFSLLFFGADTLAALMDDAQLAGLLKIGAFITLCMPLVAVLKGTFQASNDMRPVAYAQVFEQTIRVAIILVGTNVLLQFTASVYSAGKMAVVGTVIGEVAGMILLVLFLKREPQPIVKIKVAVWPILKEVTLYSIAISMSALLLLCFQLVDSFTIFKMLVASGMEVVQAMEAKGIYDRGQPLVQLGIVIATSLSLAIVPLVALKAKASNGRGAKPFIQLTYRSSLLFGVAAALGLLLVMPYVNMLLFTTDSYSNTLRLYVVQIVPLSIILTFTAVLQGYSKLKMPALFLLISIVLKLVGNVLLVPILGVLGAAIASTGGLIFAAVALVLYMKKIAVSRLASAMYYRKLLVASSAMIVVILCAVFLLDMVFTAPVMRRSVALIYSGILVSLGAFSFITVVAKLRVLTEKDWFLIPLGRRMAMYQLWLNRKK